jgi:uncharacterized protein YbjT (DUF2867 family)
MEGEAGMFAILGATGKVGRSTAAALRTAGAPEAIRPLMAAL